MKVLFSITYYELADVLKECVASLKKSINYAKKNLTDFEYAILIISNSENIKKLVIQNEKIKIIQNNYNHGFTKSCNQVFNYSIKNNFHQTVLINQDIVFKKETVYNVLNLTDKIENKISILSPFSVNKKNKFDFKVNKNLKKILINSDDDLIEVDFINAACWFINNEVIKKIGAMNEVLFHFGSDDDYAFRLKKVGGKIFLVNTEIVHLRSFYKKNFNSFYRNMQKVSSFTANAYLKVLINKNFLLALFLLIFKPAIFFLLGRLSCNNFLEIIKLKNIRTLIELNATKNNLYLEVNE
jgi:GT2 family glycosyltransferase